MSYSSTTTRVLPAPAPIFAAFSRMVDGIEHLLERMRIKHELGSMSDRDLADLGLNYSDIDDVANGTYRRG